MRIHKTLIIIVTSFLALGAYAQNAVTGVTVTGKYRKFALYGGVGPSYFINNLVIKKDGYFFLWGLSRE